MKSILFVGYSMIIIVIMVLAILFLRKPLITTNVALPGTISAWHEETHDWNAGRITVVSYQDPILGEQRHISNITPNPVMGW